MGQATMIFGRREKVAMAVLGGLLAFCVFPLQASDFLAATRETVQQWVQVEKQISAEQSAWGQEEATVRDLLALLEAEEAKLDDQIESFNREAGATERRRLELEKRRDDLSALAGEVGKQLREVENELRLLVPRLPSPLQSRLEPLTRHLTGEGAAEKRSLGQRVQTVVGILSEISKFDSEATLFTELQTLPDGRTVEVQCLYFGLGGGFFSDASGRYAGVLRPGEGGWEAKSDPAIGAAVREAISLYRHETGQSRFVSLPLEWKNGE